MEPELAIGIPLEKGIAWNIDFIRQLPDKYGESVQDKVRFMSELVKDLEKIKVMVVFENIP